MRHGSPGVSVLMSVYNAEGYVTEAVESVLAQTFGDFEFLIIDDGSTDGSLSILNRFAAQDRRIRLNRRTNGGLTDALNVMIAMARGTFLARMDADDVAMPHRFETQCAFLQSNPDHSLVGSRVVIIDPDGDELCELGDRFEHDEIVNGLLRFEGQLIYHPSVMMRREAVVAVGGYNVEFEAAQDLDLFLRLAEVSRLANVSEPLLKYRVHPQSIGHMRFVEQWESVCRAVADAHNRRGIDPPPQLPSADSAAVEHGQLVRKWGWWALLAGRHRVARKHAWRALRREPYLAANWRLMACALRGR